MENQEKAKDNIILITIDNVDGAVEERVDLDALSLDQVAELAALMPDLSDYYGDRLIKELKN
jgi:hypothetical protein